ncbi:hypothetical protein L3Y34_016757 [Caenorhabditis briggsae]|uniref:MATH domain-containing protein n=2 Tax=Caenorhabditis briggsae TaxID=6238 RepID=A0AAE9DY53_CAEBR|nr:hypothetical protein L3Y34_016757 [Caenorhabditis briggsae]
MKYYRCLRKRRLRTKYLVQLFFKSQMPKNTVLLAYFKFYFPIILIFRRSQTAIILYISKALSTSQPYSNPEFPDVCWQLILYPGGKREENAGTVSLFLKMSSRKPEQEARVKAEYQFMFLNDNEEKVFTNINVGDFHVEPPNGGHSWGLRNIPRATVERALRNDGSLVIRLEIEIMKDVFKTKPKVHEDPIDNFVSPAMEQILSKSFSTLSLAPIPAVEPTLEFTDDLPENMEVIIVEKDVPPKIYDEFDAELIN